MRTFLGKLLNIALVIFIIISALSLCSICFTRGDATFIGFKGFIVLSGSMHPTFNAGSYIIVKEKNAEEIQTGDIITYRVSTETVLTHRVIEVLKDDDEYLFITQGDANNVPDKNHVTQSQVIGVAVFWINGLGTFLAVLRQPQTLVLLGAVLCTVFIFSLVIPKLSLRKGGE